METNINALFGFLACVVIVVVFIFGVALGSGFASKNCDRFGFFTHDGTVYDCKARS